MTAQNTKSNNYELTVILKAGCLLVGILIAYGSLYLIKTFATSLYPSWAIKILEYPLIIIILGGSTVLGIGLFFFTVKLLLKRW